MRSYQGSGPGEITPDGCPVELYARLPLMGEPEIIDAAIPPGSSILELGCGTGRLLRPLADRGHPVVGVDESPPMLARVEGLPTVCSTIEALHLRRTFDVVLLASTMINAEPAQRHAFLVAARRHLDAAGVLVVQQTAPSWFETVVPSSGEQGGVRRVVTSVVRGDPEVDVAVEYHLGEQVWGHAFSRWPVLDLEADLAAADLRRDRRLTDDDVWFTARPM